MTNPALQTDPALKTRPRTGRQDSRPRRPYSEPRGYGHEERRADLGVVEFREFKTELWARLDDLGLRSVQPGANLLRPKRVGTFAGVGRFLQLLLERLSVMALLDLVLQSDDFPAAVRAVSRVASGFAAFFALIAASVGQFWVVAAFAFGALTLGMVARLATAVERESRHST